ncbi:glycosyltransferase domain-containing protein [Pseudescherichia sp.]|uniref:glycosyltransferase domain-containing protein n=1 Tax=Pseudescherichia sp. TaxID=2055881 RepID=UPI00289E7782|nr:glycosyltransferase domain-containing protein [Pseudescherichia sp.]
MQNKIAVYTCITGGYDIIRKPVVINNNIDYICFSDENIDVPFPWKLHLLSESDICNKYDRKTLNRAIKICPREFGYLLDYKQTIYIDGNIEICDDLSSLLQDVSQKDGDIFMYNHFGRDCLYKEALECLKIGHEWYWVIAKQIKDYKNVGFPVESGLYECNIIVRKENNKLDLLLKSWFNEYLTKSKRDQLSLTYVAWIHQHQIYSLGESDARFKHHHFKLHKHDNNRDNLKRKLKAKINIILMKLMGV